MPDAEEVGRDVAAGFADDPVLTWVFREPDRATKLSRLFDFLAREATGPDARASYGSPERPAPRVERAVAGYATGS